MNKILNILNSKYFLTVVIGLSIVVIIIGLLIVKRANEQAVVYAEKQKALALQKSSVEEEPAATIVNQLERLAASAQAELEASKPSATKPPENLDFVSEERRKKVAQMTNKDPEIGSEDWCELLMIRPGKDWSEQDHRDFAQHCLD